jgi:hypothetical protein
LDRCRIVAEYQRTSFNQSENCGSRSNPVKQEGLEPAGKYLAFVAVLDRDSRDSLAAIEVVLAQTAISSQLIDNLNASIHLRALLTDLFLLGEILRKQSKAAVEVVTSDGD